MNRVWAPVLPLSRTTASRLIASKYSSNLARSWPPSASPNSLDPSLQVRTLMLSNCISLNSLDYSLQVHLQTPSITASKLAQSWPPSAYLQTSSITASKCISKLAWSRPLSSHFHGLHVHISKVTQLRCPSLLDHDLGVPFLSSLDHGVVKRWS